MSLVGLIYLVCIPINACWFSIHANLVIEKESKRSESHSEVVNPYASYAEFMESFGLKTSESQGAAEKNKKVAATLPAHDDSDEGSEW
jgi:hypothetical protein